MNPDEIAAIRTRIKERLQNMNFHDNRKPYDNDINTQPSRSSVLGWLIPILAILAILATLRGC